MSSTISEIFRVDSNEKEKNTRQQRSKQTHSHKSELKNIWREVQELAASQLERPQRRRWKEQQLETLGAKVTHKENRKMPYPMLIGIRRKQREREKQQAAEEREAGIVRPKTKKLKKRKNEKTTDVRAYINQLRGNRRGRDPTQVDAPSVGTFRDGTLIISKNDIERIKHKRKGQSEDSAPPSKRRRHS